MDTNQSRKSQKLDFSADIQLPKSVLHGLELFNVQEFFEAHEALEIAWRAEPGKLRDLFRGILQVGVACYHIQRSNYSGAVKLFNRAWPWLAPFPDTILGIDLLTFRQDYQRVEAELKRLGAAQIHNFDQSLFKPVHYR